MTKLVVAGVFGHCMSFRNAAAPALAARVFAARAASRPLVAALLAWLLLAWPSPGRATLAYTVYSDHGGGRFEVEVCSDRARASLSLHAPASARAWLAVPADGAPAFDRRDGSLQATALAAGACRRYAVDAGRLARRQRQAPAGAWLLPPREWLWRPRGEAIAVRVAPAAGEGVSLPWPQRSDGTARIRAGSSLSPALAAFGAVDEQAIAIDGDRLRVATVGVNDPVRRRALQRWLRDLAGAAASVHGSLPLPDAQVLLVEVQARGRSPVPWGQSARGAGTAVHLYLSRDASIDALRADWVAMHELAHLFHPYLGARGRWLSEGLASYYQNVLRARAGLLDEREAWRRLHAGFDRGRRDRHDLPLAEVSVRMRPLGANMRTYWSGAAFWLQVDVALRARGSSLDAVLGGFRACCLPPTRRWTPEAFVAALDRQVPGDPLIQPLYEATARSSEFPSLQSVYALLGLRGGASGLAFDPSPQPRALRRAIMSGPAPAG